MILPASPRLGTPARHTEGSGSGTQSPAKCRKSKTLLRFCSQIASILFLACALPLAAHVVPGHQRAKSAPKAGRGAPLSTTSKGTIHVASPLVVVPFTATAPSGQFIYDLNEHEVRVLDNGVPQKIRHFGLSTQPTAAVIVVQANRKSARYLGSIRPLGLLFSNLLLGSKGRAAVLEYSGEVSLLMGFSGDPATLRKALQQIKARGSKARLNDALAQAIQMLAQQTQADRRVVIVFSDGTDRGSATRGDQVVRAACDANVQIYGLRFQPAKEALENGMNTLSKMVYPAKAPPGAPASVQGGQTVINFVPAAILALKMLRAQLRKNMLATYSGYTGGVVYTPLKVRSFQDTLQQIALDINSEYVLTYVPDDLKQEGFHRIQLEVSRSQLKVHTRSGYFNDAPVM